MADLTELQSSQTVKIAGADATGSETGFVTQTGNALDVNIASGVALQAAQIDSGYQPAPNNLPAGSSFLKLDASARLETHSAVYSDEGSFRDDFPGTGLTTAVTGNVAFTNGSATITGTGLASQLASGLFIKKSTDAETLYVHIDSIDSDTSATLADVYAGTSATVAAVTSRWKTTTPTGGSITVASSVATIASGTTSGQRGVLQAFGDYLPYTLNTYLSISQRIANQTAFIGFMDDNVAPNKQCGVEFTGTNNTQVNFLTASSSAAVDQQRTTVTIPSGGNTSTEHQYKVDLSANAATLSIDGVVLATHQIHLPGPYDVLNIVNQVVNSAAVTSTNLAINLVYFSNWDRVQVDNDFPGEPMTVNANVTNTVATTVSGNPSVKCLDGFGNQLTALASAPSGSELGLVTRNLPTGTQTVSGSVSVSNFPATQPVSGTVTINPLTTTSIINANAIPVDSTKATYSATSAIGFASVATAQDIFTITGSASKTLRILRIGFSATQTTAAAVNVSLLKRSTANTAGTSAAANRVPHDSTDAAASGTVLNYTANPTAGTLVGILRAVRAFIPTASLAAASQYYEFNFADRPEKAPVLRGTSEVLALNLGGVTVAGGAWTCFVTWTEE